KSWLASQRMAGHACGPCGREICVPSPPLTGCDRASNPPPGGCCSRAESDQARPARARLVDTFQRPIQEWRTQTRLDRAYSMPLGVVASGDCPCSIDNDEPTSV